MASNYTGLGVQLMTTGEKAGTWGTLTNTNWNIIEQISGGYTGQAITSTPTTLSVSDGSTGATLAHRVIEFTGSIGENTVVTIPLDVQTFYIIKNSASGSYSVQFKYVSGSGGSVTWASGDTGTKIVYATANDATDPDIIDIGMGDVTLTGTQTLTNKTLTSPKIGTALADTSGNELIKVTATGSAVNEITLANAAADNDPRITLSGGSTNIGLEVLPKGTGALVVQGNADQGGELRLYEDTDLGVHYTGFKPGNLTETISYTLPLADAGTSGDALTSNASGALSWTTIAGGLTWVVKTTTYTGVANDGVFADTSGGAWVLTLPAGTLGDEIGIVDYAATFDSNNLTVTPASGEKIQGGSADATLTCAIERAGFTLVYSGASQGWLLKDK